MSIEVNSLKLEIIIPTLGRCDNQITLNSIPAKFHHIVTLVVQDHEYQYMQTKYPTCNVWQLPLGTKGIAKTRKEIAQHWKGKAIYVMDDDLKFVTINSELKGKPMSDDEFEKFLINVRKFMDEGYVHGGMSTQTTPPDPKPYSFNTRVWTNVFYSENFNPDEIDFGEEYIMMPEDFYVTLQLLTTGYQNVVFNHCRVSPSATNAKGGCETYRTIENHNIGQDILASKFPKFVTVYEKEQTSGPWKGLKKKALKIRWKQAYLSSKSNEPSSLDEFF
jgi:hypothetical protein